MLEDKVGTMLPCNVIVQELSDGKVEVAAIDPVASMQAIDNPALKQKAQAIQAKLQKSSRACRPDSQRTFPQFENPTLRSNAELLRCGFKNTGTILWVVY